MSKVKISILAIIAVALLNACSLTRRTGKSVSQEPDSDKIENVETSCRSNNLSGDDFVISKIKIEFSSENESKSVNGFLKYKTGGDILLSLRSVAGIEVARVLLSNDSIKIYDKFNYILYVQDIEYIESKYGIPAEAIPFIWGDLPDLFNEQLNIREVDNKLCSEKRIRDIKYLLVFDKDFLKLSDAGIYHSDGREIMIDHKDFISEDRTIFPAQTRILDSDNKFEIYIRYYGVKKQKVKSMRFSTINKKETKILR